MQILVNKQVKELSIIDPRSGCDWTQDLVGNADGFDGFDDEKECYEMTQSNFDWWSNYADVEENLQDKIQDIRASTENTEKFEKALIDAGDNDFEVMQSNITDVVASYA